MLLWYTIVAPHPALDKYRSSENHCMKLLLVALSAAMFQLPAKPPMKMGLWESEGIVHMTMPNAPAMMAGMMNRPIHVRSCMTPESYAKAMGSSQQIGKDCARTNEVFTGKGYSFDISCKGKTTGHFEMTFDSDTAMHGTGHLDLSQGRASGATSDSTTTMKWVGPDCGGISPDKPEIIK